MSDPPMDDDESVQIQEFPGETIVLKPITGSDTIVSRLLKRIY